MNRQPEPDFQRLIFIGGGILLAALFLMRIHPPLAFLAFLLGAVAGFFLLGRQTLRQLPLPGRKTRARGENQEFADRIAQRLHDCRRREEKFRDEGERILRSIATLRDDIERSDQVGTEELQKAQGVIKELETEFSLRHAKASFFAECSKKLQLLLDRHRLTESIRARARELRELRRSNFDDESILEETRYGIERDTVELETIIELTRDAAISNKAEQTEALRARLEQLRTALDQQ